MPLTLRLAHAFRSVIRQRGAEYVRGKRVRLAACDDETASARVRGSGGSWYEVELHYRTFGSQPAFEASCDCPHFERGEWCKHAWAVLLMLDARGWTPSALAGGARERLALVRLGDEPEDDADVEGEEIDDDAFEADWESLPGYEPDETPHRVSAAARRKAMAGSTPRRGAGSGASDRKQNRRAPSDTWERRIERLGLLARLSAAERFFARSDARASAAPTLFVIDLDAVRARQEVRVQLARVAPRRDGQPGTLAMARLDLEALDAASPAERHLLEPLFALARLDAATDPAYGGASRWPRDPASVRALSVGVPGSLLDPVLTRLAAAGRLALVRPGVQIWGAAAGEALLPLRLDDGPAWQLRAELVRDGEEYALRGRFVRGTETLAIDAPALVLAPGFLIAGDTLARADVAGAIAAYAELRRGPLRIANADLDHAMTQLASLPDAPPIDLAPETGWAQQPGRPLARLRFEEPDPSLRRLRAELHFGYGREPVWVAASAAQTLVADRGARTLWCRDDVAEAAARDELTALGFAVSEYEEPPLSVAAGSFAPVVDALLAKGWIVEIGRRLVRPPGRSSASVRSGVDFFELDGGIDYGDEAVPYPALLEAARKGERFVRLASGDAALVPRGWLEGAGALAELGEVAGGALRFGRAQVGIVAELLEAQDEARSDRRFADLRRKIAGFRGVAALDPPRHFRGSLREYQRHGLGWLEFLRDFGLGGCLADDMGLGKTVQVLALLARRAPARGARRTSLVVAPKSVVGGWVDEAARFAPRLRVLRYEGAGRQSLRAGVLEHDLVVTTYGTLLRDVEWLASQRFDSVILDEAQAIKNAGSQTARAAKSLRAEQRLALTGTPVENHLGELASLFEFLNPGLLGRSKSFAVLARAGADGAPPDRLARVLRPFLLRRTKQEVLPELPPKTEQTLYCELEGRQARDYAQLLAHYRSALGSRLERQGIAKSKIFALEALLRLRQAACHPGLIDDARAADSSAKLELLFARLVELAEEGHKALVFSQFTSFLALVRAGLEARGIEYAYLDGATRDRQQRIERFESDPECRLFLISLKAGGTGLNLTAADYVFLLDPWWNPAVEAQAIDRAHRIGQRRPVFAYRLVARATVEEKILELQERKRTLAGSIFGSEESLVASLDAAELRWLLG